MKSHNVFFFPNICSLYIQHPRKERNHLIPFFSFLLHINAFILSYSFKLSRFYFSRVYRSYRVQSSRVSPRQALHKVMPLSIAQSYTSLYIYIKKKKKKKNIATYLENLIIRLHALYALIKHVKFCTNQLLFTIQSINFFYT